VPALDPWTRWGRLMRLMAVLPTLDKDILTLRVIVGMSAVETAETLGISPGNVRVTQHRVLAKLRRMINDAKL
jgi:RNA polymerase sigma-70 factor (ECF subfamily)